MLDYQESFKGTSEAPSNYIVFGQNEFGWEQEDKSQIKKLYVLPTVITRKSDFKKLNQISSVAYKQKFRNFFHKCKPQV